MAVLKEGELADWIQNKLIDIILRVEVECECYIDILPEEQHRINAAVKTIATIIDSSRHSKEPYPSPDDKIEEIQLERAFGDAK